MSPLSEKACADVLTAAVARAAQPCCARGAPEPKAGPPPAERASAADGSALPQMGPQPPVQGSDRARAVSGNDRPSTAAPDAGGSHTGRGSDEDERGQVREPVHEFAAEETLLIFDWDDTVMPSTWLHQQGLRLDDDDGDIKPEQWEQLAKVAAVTRSTLLAAKKFGRVVIVTNAERGWIELSCAKFLPSVAVVLEDVKLISARTLYETSDVTDPEDWKTMAFGHEIERVYADRAGDADQKKNVLSLGDSLHEREALLTVTSRLPNCRHKSLKFVERPDILQICEQHELVTGNLEKIVHHDGHVDLSIRCP